MKKILLLTLALAGATLNAPGATMPTNPPPEEAVILTPPAPRAPRINGPLVYGVHPGSPFLYRIPCTGERPMQFSAENLPDGLTLDAQSGIITGKISTAGTNSVTLIARNSHGKVKREFRIIAGQQLALTPPMGWNSWYIHYNRVTDAMMRQSADQMIDTGMADYGYQYVNIDDCWMKKRGDAPYRDADGAVLPNEKFPRHEGACRLHSRQGIESRTLYLARSEDVRPDTPALTNTRPPMRGSLPTGVLIF